MPVQYKSALTILSVYSDLPLEQFDETFEGEVLVRTQPTTLLQMVCEFLLDQYKMMQKKPG